MTIRSLAIFRNELRILRRDQAMAWSLLVMPLILMTFVKPIYRATLQQEGYAGANGSEQAVPGMAVLFAFFIVGNVGFVFFREHGWGTWERLRASPALKLDIILGKATLLFLVSLLQQAILFAYGGLVMGLQVRGSLLTLAVVSVALSFALVAFGVAISAIFSRIEHVNIVQTLGAMLSAGLGGALTPIALLPGWAQALGRVTPSYWAVSAYRAVILDGAGLEQVATAIVVLLGMAMVFIAVALWAFRVEQSKQYWA